MYDAPDRDQGTDTSIRETLFIYIYIPIYILHDRFFDFPFLTVINLICIFSRDICFIEIIAIFIITETLLFFILQSNLRLKHI